MADNSKKETIQSGDDNSLDSIFNSEIGDDWGEAFEAEDFLLAGDDASSEAFFLDDDSLEDTASPAADSVDPRIISEQTPPSSKSFFSISGLKSYLAGTFNKLKTIFAAAPVYGKISIIAAPFIIILTLFFILRPSSSLDNEQADNSSSSSIAESASLDSQVRPEESQEEGYQGEPRETGSTPFSSSPSKSTSFPPEEKNDLPELSGEPVDKAKVKWPLPSFLIPASSETGGQGNSFLAIDLTLVLVLAPDEDVPEDKEFYARELIYQFYQNRPLGELQRYSLARGEMNNKLRAWIEKQWPDIPLSSITFESYQFL